MEKKNSKNSVGKSGKSVSANSREQIKSYPLTENTNNSPKTGKKGYIKDNGDWGTTEMRGAKKY